MLESNQMTCVHVNAEEIRLENETVLRITKEKGNLIPDTNSFLLVDGTHFHNGSIQVKLRSRILPGIFEQARGFIGIVFRVNAMHSEFESFYVRPANGRNCTDPIRRQHGCQYFSFPGYTFSYFRDFGITDFENRVDLELDEWFTLKAVIQDEKASFYLNGSEEPVLVVNEMKHGKGTYGQVGVYVDNGTDGFVKDIVIHCTD